MATTNPKKLTGSEIIALVKAGDFVEINGKRSSTTYPSIRPAGTYQVVDVDKYDQEYPLRLNYKSGDDRWMQRDRFVRIVERDGKPYEEATPVTVDARPICEQVLAGDTIQVEGDGDIDDGPHIVERTDGGLSSGPRGVGIRVIQGWIHNETAKKILLRDGRPFGETALAVIEEPAWKRAKVGDTIRVVGAGSRQPDGNYRVNEVDESNGLNRRLRVENPSGAEWVENRHVVEIVSTNDQTVADTRPVWELVKVGDRIRIEGHSYLKNGIHTVTKTDIDLRRGPTASGAQIGAQWVQNDRIKEILAPETLTQLPAVLPQPAWQVAKVGDRVRVVKGSDHEAGVFEVTRVHTGSSSYRVAVDYQRKGRVWWIENDKIQEVVAPDVQSVSAVRGNFLIHVDVPAIMRNKAEGRHDPVTAVRRISAPTEQEVYRELAWDGPTRFVHHEFMRIEGTDIQNWIETDAPISAWLDGQGLQVLNPRPGQAIERYQPMTRPILGGFVIHIAAPVLMRNRQEGRNDPVIAVRKAHANWADDVVFCRKVEWSGPTRLVHRPTTPIPGTNGRGVAFVETDATLTLTLDDAEPLVLSMPGSAGFVPVRVAA